MDQRLGRRRYLAALKSGIRLRNSWGRDDVVVNLALTKTPFGESGGMLFACDTKGGKLFYCENF